MKKTREMHIKKPALLVFLLADLFIIAFSSRQLFNYVKRYGPVNVLAPQAAPDGQSSMTVKHKKEKPEKNGSKTNTQKVNPQGKQAPEPEENLAPPPAPSAQGTRKIAFTLFSSKAKKVAITGSFNNWSAGDELVKEGANKWTKSVSLQPGQHFYQYIVDGKTIKDPNNRDTWDIPGHGECSSINLRVIAK